MLRQMPLQFQKIPGNHLLLYYYTRRVKEAVHIRLRMLQHELDIGSDIPETWMLTTGNTKLNNFATVDSERTFGQCANRGLCGIPANHSQTECFIRSCISTDLIA